MIRVPAAFLSALIGLFANAGCTTPPPQRNTTPVAGSAEWIRLFDGNTLDGWQKRGGVAEFRIEDGEIVGETRPNTPNTFLCTGREFCDFTLEIEFKVDDSLNSGVQFRSQARQEKGSERVFGYQAEIDPSPRAWTGGIYDEARRGWFAPIENTPEARTAFRPGEWNSLRIDCRGDHIRTWVNGVLCADIRDSATACGFVALQVHGVGAKQEPMRVRWRNIRILPR